MFLFHRPSSDYIRGYLSAQADSELSYSCPGCTREGNAAGFTADRHRVFLGHGAKTFHWARQAISRWAMFPVPMAQLFSPEPPRLNLVVALLLRAGPLWSLNPCRVVYTMDEVGGQVTRYGFAYGTLPDHLECGEERFSVEWHRSDDSVWYDLFALSRPQHWLAVLGKPIVRLEQARFRRLSGKAMQQFVWSAMAGQHAESEGTEQAAAPDQRFTDSPAFGSLTT